MIITFCGHSNFCEAEKIEPILLSLLRDEIGGQFAELFLGGYGGFDEFAYRCGKKLKSENERVKLTFVTPYITEGQPYEHRYDEILYPEIERVPYRFAIVARNKWMIDKADLVISYINHDWGGAYKSYLRAVKKNKRVINLGKFNII